MEKLNLTQEWDKVFPKSDKVDHNKVTFHNRYGITLAADLYTPKGTEGKLPAIAVSGPFGAVKGVNPKFCVNAKLWCKIEQKYFKAGAAQAAAAFSTKITALQGDVKGGGVSLRSS